MPGDRTEQATPRQRQKAADKGDRARSRDLMAAAAMVAVAYTLGGVAPRWVASWGGMYRALLAIGAPAFQDHASSLETAMAIRGVAMKALEPVGILFLVSLAAAVAAGIAQGEAGPLNFEALGIQTGAAESSTKTRRIFLSLRGVARLGKSWYRWRSLGFFAVKRDRGADRCSGDEQRAVSRPVCRNVQPAGEGGLDFPCVGWRSTT